LTHVRDKIVALLEHGLLDTLEALVQLAGELVDLLRVLRDGSSGRANDTREPLLKARKGLLRV